MITHKEARKYVLNYFPILSKETQIMKYFEQQEKKDKLLELYQSLCEDYPQKIWHKEFDKIKSLEEELK